MSAYAFLEALSQGGEIRCLLQENGMGRKSFSLFQSSSSREKRSEWGWLSKPGASEPAVVTLIPSQSLENMGI